MKPIINEKDFLCDDLFVYWRTHPTEELDHFWEDFLHKNETLKEPFDKAVSKFNNLRNTGDRFVHNEIIVKKSLTQMIARHKRRQMSQLIITLSAAILLLGLITTLYFLSTKPKNSEPSLASVGKVMNDAQVKLLAGGQILNIRNNSTLDLSEKKNSAIVQDSITLTEITLDKHQTNKLIVPFGKRSSIVLADGSKVYLNSGTEMDFPSAFSKTSREIWVEGEIFIDVTQQKGLPFIIHTPNSQITVYGTSFNVSSYTDEKRESVVLVQGSVEVKNISGAIRLKPDEMALIENGTMTRKKVDVSAYISWKSGYLQMSKTPLNEVLQKIGRYYNVEFRFPDNLKLEERTCSGKLYLSDNMEDVMEAFSKLTSLTHGITDKTIYIK